ncbi:hypothetical protein [Falsiroseomonas ponticola]|uniref:hypothetical protein n=1 Tax=Falsiroseomonas ponticola TaxID=2786951 RepID=UPI001933EE35|nr:hypothetical protein [Roseomonas ponticola]
MKTRTPPSLAELRARIAGEIDRLIFLLDLLDGDPDCEPDPVEDDDDAEASLQPLTLARIGGEA